MAESVMMNIVLAIDGERILVEGVLVNVVLVTDRE